MELLGWMLLGLLVGLIARITFPPRPDSGLVLFILLGIAGAMLAGFVHQALAVGEVSVGLSYGAALLGALAMILFYRGMLRHRR